MRQLSLLLLLIGTNLATSCLIGINLPPLGLMDLNLAPRIQITNASIGRTFQAQLSNKAARLAWEEMYNTKELGLPDWTHGALEPCLDFITSAIRIALTKHSPSPLRILDAPSGRGLLARHLIRRFAQDAIHITTSDIISSTKPLPYLDPTDMLDKTIEHRAFMLGRTRNPPAEYYPLEYWLPEDFFQNEPLYRHVVADALQWPFQNAAFGMIVSTYFLGYLPWELRMRMAQNYFSSLADHGLLVVLLHHARSHHSEDTIAEKAATLAVLELLQMLDDKVSGRADIDDIVFIHTYQLAHSLYRGSIPARINDMLMDQRLQSSPAAALKEIAALRRYYLSRLAVFVDFSPFSSGKSAEHFFRSNGFHVTVPARIITTEANIDKTIALVLRKPSTAHYRSGLPLETGI